MVIWSAISLIFSMIFEKSIFGSFLAGVIICMYLRFKSFFQDFAHFCSLTSESFGSDPQGLVSHSVISEKPKWQTGISFIITGAPVLKLRGWTALAFGMIGLHCYWILPFLISKAFWSSNSLLIWVLCRHPK